MLVPKVEMTVTVWTSDDSGPYNVTVTACPHCKKVARCEAFCEHAILVESCEHGFRALQLQDLPNEWELEPFHDAHDAPIARIARRIASEAWEVAVWEYLREKLSAE